MSENSYPKPSMTRSSDSTNFVGYKARQERIRAFIKQQEENRLRKKIELEEALKNAEKIRRLRIEERNKNIQQKRQQELKKQIEAKNRREAHEQAEMEKALLALRKHSERQIMHGTSNNNRTPLMTTSLTLNHFVVSDLNANYSNNNMIFDMGGLSPVQPFATKAKENNVVGGKNKFARISPNHTYTSTNNNLTDQLSRNKINIRKTKSNISNIATPDRKSGVAFGMSLKTPRNLLDVQLKGIDGRFGTPTRSNDNIMTRSLNNRQSIGLSSSKTTSHPSSVISARDQHDVTQFTKQYSSSTSRLSPRSYDIKLKSNVSPLAKQTYPSPKSKQPFITKSSKVLSKPANSMAKNNLKANLNTNMVQKSIETVLPRSPTFVKNKEKIKNATEEIQTRQIKLVDSNDDQIISMNGLTNCGGTFVINKPRSKDNITRHSFDSDTFISSNNNEILPNQHVETNKLEESWILDNISQEAETNHVETCREDEFLYILLPSETPFGLDNKETLTLAHDELVIKHSLPTPFINDDFSKNANEIVILPSKGPDNILNQNTENEILGNAIHPTLLEFSETEQNGINNEEENETISLSCPTHTHNSFEANEKTTNTENQYYNSLNQTTAWGNKLNNEEKTCDELNNNKIDKNEQTKLLLSSPSNCALDNNQNNIITEKIDHLIPSIQLNNCDETQISEPFFYENSKNLITDNTCLTSMDHENAVKTCTEHKTIEQINNSSISLISSHSTKEISHDSPDIIDNKKENFEKPSLFESPSVAHHEHIEKFEYDITQETTNSDGENSLTAAAFTLPSIRLIEATPVKHTFNDDDDTYQNINDYPITEIIKSKDPISLFTDNNDDSILKNDENPQDNSMIAETTDVLTTTTTHHIMTEQEAKTEMAKQRRMAKELARQAWEREQERIRLEREAEEAKQLAEQEEMDRLARECKLMEERRLQEAIKQHEKKLEEDAKKQAAKDELRKKNEEASLLAAQKIKQIEDEARKQEEERLERKKKLDAIMSRTRRSTASTTPISQTPTINPYKVDTQNNASFNVAVSTLDTTSPRLGSSPILLRSNTSTTSTTNFSSNNNNNNTSLNIANTIKTITTSVMTNDSTHNLNSINDTLTEIKQSSAIISNPIVRNILVSTPDQQSTHEKMQLINETHEQYRYPISTLSYINKEYSLTKSDSSKISPVLYNIAITSTTSINDVQNYKYNNKYDKQNSDYTDFYINDIKTSLSNIDLIDHDLSKKFPTDINTTTNVISLTSTNDLLTNTFLKTDLLDPSTINDTFSNISSNQPSNNDDIYTPTLSNDSTHFNQYNANSHASDTHFSNPIYSNGPSNQIIDKNFIVSLSSNNNTSPKINGISTGTITTASAHRKPNPYISNNDISNHLFPNRDSTFIIPNPEDLNHLIAEEPFVPTDEETTTDDDSTNNNQHHMTSMNAKKKHHHLIPNTSSSAHKMAASILRPIHTSPSDFERDFRIENTSLSSL